MTEWLDEHLMVECEIAETKEIADVDLLQLGDSLEYFGCGLFRSCSIFFGQKNVTLVGPIVSLAMQSLSENF